MFFFDNGPAEIALAQGGAAHAQQIDRLPQGLAVALATERRSIQQDDLAFDALSRQLGQLGQPVGLDCGGDDDGCRPAPRLDAEFAQDPRQIGVAVGAQQRQRP